MFAPHLQALARCGHDWRMNKRKPAPLAGRRILLTRAADSIAETAARVREAGGEPIAFPCLKRQCLPEEIRRAADLAKACDAVAFTSANAIACLRRAAPESLMQTLRKLPVIAVGRRTARALDDAALPPAHVAEPASQEGMIALFRRIDWPKRLLFFRAEQGGDKLPQAVRAHGGECLLVRAYRMDCPEDDAEPMRARLRAGEIDAVLLGSARCARHYARRIGDPALASRPVIVTISEQAAREAIASGLRADIIAPRPDFDAMLQALARRFARNAPAAEEES